MDPKSLFSLNDHLDADFDDAAHSFRSDPAHHSELMPPGF